MECYQSNERKTGMTEMGLSFHESSNLEQG